MCEEPTLEIDGVVDIKQNQNVGSIDYYYDNFEFNFEILIQPYSLSDNSLHSVQGNVQNHDIKILRGSRKKSLLNESI